MSHEDTVDLEIDEDVYAKIAAIAAREGTDIDRMIRDMVRESIAEAEAQKSPDRTDTPIHAGLPPAPRSGYRGFRMNCVISPRAPPPCPPQDDGQGGNPEQAQQLLSARQAPADGGGADDKGVKSAG